MNQSKGRVTTKMLSKDLVKNTQETAYNFEGVCTNIHRSKILQRLCRDVGLEM